MTTGMIHILGLVDLTYKESIRTGGTWPKVIVFSSDQKTAYVSNWVSRDISVLDTETRKIDLIVDAGGTPRGMAIGPDGRRLYVGLYDTGELVVLVTLDNKITARWLVGGSLRHLVIDQRKNILYVSDMYHGCVHAVSLEDYRVNARVDRSSRIASMKWNKDLSWSFLRRKRMGCVRRHSRA